MNQAHHEQSNTWQWLVDGWHALRDKAVAAVTFFTPQREQEVNSQRWGVLATDVTEHKNYVGVELELPGLEKEDLSVEVHKDRVVISGEKRASDTRHEGSLVVTERAYGRFQRVIGLPCEVQSSGTEASYVNGVLSIKLAKDESLQPRSIPISHS